MNFSHLYVGPGDSVKGPTLSDRLKFRLRVLLVKAGDSFFLCCLMTTDMTNRASFCGANTLWSSRMLGELSSLCVTVVYIDVWALARL